MFKVCIVVPFYKRILSTTEQVSLCQLYKVLSNYQIIFIMPKSLLSFEDLGNKSYTIERFPDEYFQSIRAYSMMMLSESFYKRFVDYDFMLVYQLDAFVFEDCLLYFCEKQYDYIGAPWTYFNRTNGCTNQVGNGGFSLRHIRHTLSLLKATRILRAQSPFCELWKSGEDRFFSYAGEKHLMGFSCAPQNIAIEFSFEENVRLCYKKNHYKLPFGCHAWMKFDFEFFRPFFASCGYFFGIKSAHNFTNLDVIFRKKRIMEYCSRRYLRQGDSYALIRHIIEETVKWVPRSYIVFGSGCDGQRCVAFFKIENVEVRAFFDNGIDQQGKVIDGIPVMKPLYDNICLNNDFICVASNSYKKEIIKQLKSFGLQEGRDFMDFEIIRREIVRRYFGILCIIAQGGA